MQAAGSSELPHRAGRRHRHTGRTRRFLDRGGYALSRVRRDIHVHSPPVPDRPERFPAAEHTLFPLEPHV